MPQVRFDVLQKLRARRNGNSQTLDQKRVLGVSLSLTDSCVVLGKCLSFSEPVSSPLGKNSG